MTIFQIATRVLDPNGAVAFTHQVSTAEGYIKMDYLIGFLSIAAGSRDTKLAGKPVVVIDGDYDLGGRLEIPAETRVRVNGEGAVEFKHGSQDHRLTFYQNIPMHFS
jgi:hypothetical protein